MRWADIGGWFASRIHRWSSAEKLEHTLKGGAPISQQAVGDHPVIILGNYEDAPLQMPLT
jgi:hypothetical protein